MSPGTSGPRFAAGGPNAEEYGAHAGYPIKGIPRAPFFVGGFSHYDQIFEGRLIRRAATPSRLTRASGEPVLRYESLTETRTLDEYLARNPTTGLLIARGDTILVERYQYARNDRHRFTSFSMAKTVTAMLVGIVIAEGRIRSVDDLAAAYVPALADTEYGRTSLRHLLEMSSGVRFVERYSGQNDVARLFSETVIKVGAGGVEAVKPYNERLRPGGTTFAYASVETQVLGLVLRNATGHPVADYLQEKIWEPIGAEADATWLIDAARHRVVNDSGMLCQFLGDSVVGLFGVPEAPTGYLEQAVECARRLVDIGASVATEWQRQIDQIQPAAGVHVSMTLGDLQVLSLRPLSRTHMGVIGDSINLAARLNTAAGSDEIVVSNTLYQRLPDTLRLEFQELPPVEAKNTGRIRAWKLGPRRAPIGP